MVIFDFVQKGGIVMYPLILMILIAYTLLIERYFYLKKVVSSLSLIETARSLISEKKFSELESHLKQDEGCVSFLIQKGLHYFDDDESLLEDRLKQAIYEQAPDLQKYVSTIHILAVLMPMMGLLGTITGMISVFKAISVVGVGDPQALSGGISEALITTQTGLFAAIPTLFCHSLLSEQVDGVLMSLKRCSMSLLNLSRLNRKDAHV